MSIYTLEEAPSVTARRTTLACYRLPSFDAEKWDNVISTFAGVPAHPFGQHWLPNLEPRFLPSTARVGYDDAHFWVLADFEDNDIFNKAIRLNEVTYKLGDVFEIFLRPLPGEEYVEFHVTPDNQRLQLWCPRAMSGDDDPEWKMHYLTDFCFESWTQVLQEENRWRILAAVPYAKLNTVPPSAGDEWLFSFGRYDYTRGVRRPVLSSTSRHRFPNFHHQHEWGRLTFCEEKFRKGQNE